MKLIFLLLFGFILLTIQGDAQVNKQYSVLVKEATLLYNNKEYLKSGQMYAKAFVALDNKGLPNDRYNAACSWALAGEIDSAFIQLFKIAQNGNYSKYFHLTSDPDLEPLHDDERWESVKKLVVSNKEKEEAGLEHELVAMLDTVYWEDQFYRKQINGIEQKFEHDSPEMRTQWKLIREKDSINLIKIRNILDERGWLGEEVIGRQGNLTLFLVIQHADTETQDKYLPMMKEAVKKGNARASSLALLEDRLALRHGKRQIYGSQLARDNATGEYYVSPLIDPENVDARRAEVGLGSMAEYVSRWNVTWDVEQHRIKTAEIESRMKEQE